MAWPARSRDRRLLPCAQRSLRPALFGRRVGNLITGSAIHYGYYMPFGLLTPASWVAMFTKRYMHLTGCTRTPCSRWLTRRASTP